MSHLQRLKPYDFKPFPVLWHEDSGGRRQQTRERYHLVLSFVLEPIIPKNPLLCNQAPKVAREI